MPICQLPSPQIAHWRKPSPSLPALEKTSQPANESHSIVAGNNSNNNNNGKRLSAKSWNGKWEIFLAIAIDCFTNPIWCISLSLDKIAIECGRFVCMCVCEIGSLSFSFFHGRIYPYIHSFFRSFIHSFVRPFFLSSFPSPSLACSLPSLLDHPFRPFEWSGGCCC